MNTMKKNFSLFHKNLIGPLQVKLVKAKLHKTCWERFWNICLIHRMKHAVHLSQNSNLQSFSLAVNLILWDKTPTENWSFLYLLCSIMLMEYKACHRNRVEPLHHLGIWPKSFFRLPSLLDHEHISKKKPLFYSKMSKLRSRSLPLSTLPTKQIS